MASDAYIPSSPELPIGTGVSAALPAGFNDAPVLAGAGGGASAAAGLSMLNPAAIGLQMASQMVQGIMGFASGIQKSRQDRAAAAQASILGGISTQEALLQTRGAVGRGATLAAASGGGLGGTTAGVLNQIAERGMFNARAAAYRGATQAETDRYMARVDKDNAINSLISGVGGAAFSGLGGASQQSSRAGILASKDPESISALPYLG